MVKRNPRVMVKENPSYPVNRIPILGKLLYSFSKNITGEGK
jgi:hypothetical protein